MRVIAGTLRGRRLAAPRGRATRPTSDRVREAIFAALGDVERARVLDLYAGSGALGIEALSRGAAQAVFVERARPALAAIRHNLIELGVAERALVLAAPVARAAERLGELGPFDLAFADPPYARVAAERELALVVARAVWSPGARLVVEHAHRDGCPHVEGTERLETRRYGDTAISYLLIRGAVLLDLDEPTPTHQN